MNRQELGTRLKLLRKNRTQKEFASQYGIPQGTLSKYERGKLEPGIDFLTEVSKREDVSINWILTGEMDDKARKWMLREPMAEYEVLPISTRKLLNSAIEILESGNEVMIDALKANVRAYLEAIRVANKDSENKGRAK
ncbi:MAG: helix-turn-helix domain-containing protein [Thermodesulfobacteriota bacterium]|jgi:transcriptional regulator with XRE-family HTH domain